MLNQNIQSNITCQQENKSRLKNRKHTPYQWNTLVLPEKDTWLGTIAALSPKQRKILSVIITLCFRYDRVYATQSKIAKMADCGRIHAWKTLHELERLGFIGILGNGANKSCWYKISDWFKDPWVQKSLKNYLAIFFFSLVELTSFSIQSRDLSEATRCKNDLYFIKQETGKEEQTSSVRTITYSKEDNQRKILKKKGRVVNATLEKIKNDLNLGNYETNQLSNFGEVVLREGWLVLNKPQNKDITNKFRYLLGVCRNLSAGKNNQQQRNSSFSNRATQNLTKVTNSAKSDNVYLVKSDRGKNEQISENNENFSQKNEAKRYPNFPVKEVKKYTALQIANEIYNFMKPEHLENFAKLMGNEAAEKYRNRCVENLLQNEYQLSGEVGEDIAVKVIETYKAKFNTFAVIPKQI